MGVGGNAVRQVLAIQKMDEAFDIALFDSNPIVVEEREKREHIWMYPYMDESSLKADRWILDNYALVYNQRLSGTKKARINALFEKQKNTIGDTKLMDDSESRIKELSPTYQNIDILVSFDNEEERVFVKHLSEGLKEMKKKVCWWVIFPFDFEGYRRKNLASAGYELLIDTYPSVSIVYRNKMKASGSHLKEQFDYFDHLVYRRIKGYM